jgi:DNA-binding response OmpR family regulator
MVNDKIILLVEDNAKLNEINRRALEKEGYNVLTALTLTAASEHLSRTCPDIILLDVALPDGNGIDFCDEIREKTNAHILFLTSRREHGEKLKGLAVGGDDYITKPFKLDELVQRVKVAMRRREMDKEPPRTLSFGSLTMDIITDRAYYNGTDLNLQPKEFTLLRLFAENENRLLDADYIYQTLWNQPMINNKNAIQKAVSRLRKKIEHTGHDIDTARDKGYIYRKK